jgi:hypothetical protein
LIIIVYLKKISWLKKIFKNEKWKLKWYNYKDKWIRFCRLGNKSKKKSDIIMQVTNNNKNSFFIYKKLWIILI